VTNEEAVLERLPVPTWSSEPWTQRSWGARDGDAVFVEVDPALSTVPTSR
jgi:hypothetical protein